MRAWRDKAMEDATITPLVKERFPSVVDTDDLIFELGKQIVKIINHEKLLNSMVQKTQALGAATSEVAKARSDMEAEKKELQKSNAFYQENNRKLDAALVQVRNEKAMVETSLLDKNKAMEAVILEKDKLIAELKEQIVKHDTGKKRRKRLSANT